MAIQSQLRTESTQGTTPFKVKYFTSAHEIELETLLETHTALLSILSQIHQKLQPETKLRIRVSAIQKGSLEVPWLVDVAQEMLPLAPIVMSDPAVRAHLVNVIEFAGKYFKLRKLLNGKKPERVDVKDGGVNVIIDGNNNKVDVSVYQFARENAAADKAARTLARRLKADRDVSCLEIQKGKKTLLAVRRSDLSAIADDNQLLEPKEEHISVDASLAIVKPELHDPAKRTWRMIYNGNRISARLADLAFIRKVNEGARFGKGDALEVEMKIYRKWNDKLRTFVNSRYEIIRVVAVKQRGSQISFIA